MAQTEAFVLAGGYGTRMGNLTSTRQKCMLPINGMPVLGYVMEMIKEAFGSADLKIGVGYKAEQVLSFVKAHNIPNLRVTCVPHEPGIEDWSVYRAIDPFIHGPFIGLPGDVIARPEACRNVMSAFETSNATVAMALSPHVDVVDTHGVGKLRDGMVVDFRCPPPSFLDSDHLRDLTFYAADRRFFSLLDRYPRPGKRLSPVFAEMIPDGVPISGVLYNEAWLHIGYPADIDKGLL